MRAEGHDDGDRLQPGAVNRHIRSAENQSIGQEIGEALDGVNADLGFRIRRGGGGHIDAEQSPDPRVARHEGDGVNPVRLEHHGAIGR
ncbi:MAG TPA: hypothetical protein VLA89_17335, partial [Gemmatimonadales bacterium]|nr:hypothetical protein [Gemmatimonadales bacterium]